MVTPTVTCHQPNVVPGSAAEVLTPPNLKRAYDIDVAVFEAEYKGHRHHCVQPIENIAPIPISEEEGNRQ